MGFKVLYDITQSKVIKLRGVLCAEARVTSSPSSALYIHHINVFFLNFKFNCSKFWGSLSCYVWTRLLKFMQPHDPWPLFEYHPLPLFPGRYHSLIREPKEAIYHYYKIYTSTLTLILTTLKYMYMYPCTCSCMNYWECAQFDSLIQPVYGQFSINRWKRHWFAFPAEKLAGSHYLSVWSWLKKTCQATV